MVERLQIKRILEEIKLSMTGLIDEKTAQKAGELMGADLMVVGGYQKFGDEIRITARFVKDENYNLSIKMYTKALRADPNYAEAHNNLGIAYYQKGWYEKAISSYRKAIELNPTDGRPYINLAISYYLRRNSRKQPFPILIRRLKLTPRTAPPTSSWELFIMTRNFIKKPLPPFRKA